MAFWNNWRRILPKAALPLSAAGLAMLLAGCILAPGNFTSTLDLRRDGSFTYAYQGEIHLLGLSRLSEMAGATSPGEFTPYPCYDDDDYSQRECSPEEIEQQREEWQEQAAHRQTNDESNSRMLGTLFGGFDPSQPDAAEEIAARLRRQKGWNSVEYKGDGIYAVDFSITSRMTHDFSFPVMEGFMMSNGFVSAILREGNVVRIDAPGFSAQSANMANPNANFLQLAALMDENDPEAEGLALMPKLNGSFTITTDAVILANNTDEGPSAVSGGQKLEWKVTPRTSTAPMALIRLGD